MTDPDTAAQFAAWATQQLAAFEADTTRKPEPDDFTDLYEAIRRDTQR